MLDDLKMIHQRDPQDVLGTVAGQWRQLQHDFAVEGGEGGDISNIVFAGMSGSAFGADIARQWPTVVRPFEIVRGYDIPAYVGPDTLFIATSYSGTTEETLAALEQAAKKGARIAVITAGGDMAGLAHVNGYRLVVLPTDVQSRFAGWYILKALLALLESYGLVQGASQELAGQAGWLADCIAGWQPDVATFKNRAKQIALELMGKSVVIYSGPLLSPVAYRWKTDINENAKQIAWCGQYPEFNHNEFASWSRQPVQKPYAVVELHSPLDHPRITRRYEVSQRLLSGLRPAPIIVEPSGDSLLQQLLYTAALGDFVSLYLALLGNTNPSPLEIVDKLKKELA